MWQPSAISNLEIIAVQNGDGYGNGPATQEKLPLHYLTTPTIDSFEPPMICVSDGSKDVVLTGTFIVASGTTQRKLPAFTLVFPFSGSKRTWTPITKSVPPASCTKLALGPLATRDLHVCTVATITVAQDAVIAGIFQPDVIMSITAAPEGAIGVDQYTDWINTTCPVTIADKLLVVTKPQFDGARPTFMCESEGVADVVIKGAYFFETKLVGQALLKPTVDMRDNNANNYTATVAFNDGKTNVVAQSDITLSDCADVIVPKFESVRYCSTVTLKIDPLSSGAFSIVQFANAMRITHPNPSISSCAAVNPHDLMSIPNPMPGFRTALASPAISDISLKADETCLDELPQAAAFSGVYYNYLAIDPTAKVNLVNATSAVLNDCVNFNHGTESVDHCSWLGFNLPATTILGDLPIDIRVATCPAHMKSVTHNFPDPVLLSGSTTAIEHVAWQPGDEGTFTTSADALVGYTTPKFPGIPARVCYSATKNLKFTGLSFARFLNPYDGTGSRRPKVTFTLDTTSRIYQAEADFEQWGGCAQAGSASAPKNFGGDLDLCTSFNVTLPASTFIPSAVDTGYVTLKMQNSKENDAAWQCEGSSSTVLRVLPDPVIANLVPFEYCVDQGATVTVTGQDFDRNPEDPSDPMY
jgi:hypothetical protein